MTLGLIVAAGVCLAVSVRRWWALLLPLSIGCLSAAVVMMQGHGLRDTPIGFLVAMATVAVAVGMLLRTLQSRHSS